METQLFTLGADYGTSKSVIMSADASVLRMFGQDHHAAAKIKPELTLTDPQGNVVATMDEWANEWTEGRS